jgi:hypothetical protein
MALGNGKVNKVKCTERATNESCRPNRQLPECINQILIALEVVEKNTKYVKNRGSFSKWVTSDFFEL